MIKINTEPEGHLLQRADIFAWLEGLSVEQWKKIRPTLRTVQVPGCTRPYYPKPEIRKKLVDPILNQTK